MKAKEGVVEKLNGLLTAELTAINQFFLHAEMCENWGYERLYHEVRGRSISEMKDAEELIEHILYLEGVPNVQRLGTISVGETVSEQLNLDLKSEKDMVINLTDAITHCAKVGDYTTRRKLEKMVEDEEQHIDWIEAQLDQIKQVGLENYLSQQIKKAE
jgi:bacterioferritin